jgi:hypothetical protein
MFRDKGGPLGQTDPAPRRKSLIPALEVPAIHQCVTDRGHGHPRDVYEAPIWCIPARLVVLTDEPAANLTKP